MAKLSLNAKPVFQAKVGIPVAGGDAVEVLFNFKHRTKTQLEEFIKSRAKQSDTDSFMEMVEGWELEDEFTKENVEKLLENYIGAALETFRVYVDELVQARLKN
jgi:hypothetical protein